MGHLYDDECPECAEEQRQAIVDTLEEMGWTVVQDGLTQALWEEKELLDEIRPTYREWISDPENRKNARKVVISGTHMSFTAILDEIEEMHDKKQQDYGRVEDPYANVRASEDFGIPAWVGTIVRANDKMRRLQKFAQDQTLVNESVEDSLLDLAVYAIIALDLYRQENNPEWKEAWQD